MTCSQLSLAKEMANSFEKSSMYVLKSDSNDVIEKEYLTDEMKINRAEYSFSCEEVNGKEIIILNMNEIGYKKGLPYFIDDLPYLFSFNNISLEKNCIYSNNINSENEVINYSNYFSKKEIKNVFYNTVVDVEYIRIVDNITECDYAIYEIYNNEIENFYAFNSIDESNIVCTGKYLNSNIHSFQLLMMKILVIIAIIPLLFSLISMGMYYKYYMASMREELNIMHIYYLEAKKMKYGLTLILLGYYCLISFIPLLSMYFIFIPGEVEILILTSLMVFIMQSIVIFICVNHEVKKISKSNVWRNVDD